MDNDMKNFLIVISIMLVIFLIIFLFVFLIQNIEPAETTYYKYGLSDGRIICCTTAIITYGNANFYKCKDGIEYNAQVNIIDYNEVCK